MFLVALILFVATVNAACDNIGLITCLTGVGLPGNPGACTCWDNFLTTVGDCDFAQFTAAYTQAKLSCSSVDVSVYTPKNCLEAQQIYTICLSDIIGSTKSACDCYDNLQKQTTLCTTEDNKLLNLGLCIGAKATCGAIECDCSALNSVLPSTETSFEACISNANGDKCACYSAVVSQVSNWSEDCDFAAEVDLKACVQSQLGCSTLLNENKCVATKVSLSITDIDDIFTGSKDQFISTWNTALSSDGIVITSADHTVPNPGQIVFTLGVTYDENQNTTQEVIDALKAEFSATVGLKLEQLDGKVVVATGKRATSGSTTVVMTGTNTPTNPPPGNTGSAVSVVMIPLIAITGVLHYFF